MVTRNLPFVVQQGLLLCSLWIDFGLSSSLKYDGGFPQTVFTVTVHMTEENSSVTRTEGKMMPVNRNRKIDII